MLELFTTSMYERSRVASDVICDDEESDTVGDNEIGLAICSSSIESAFSVINANLDICTLYFIIIYVVIHC